MLEPGGFWDSEYSGLYILIAGLLGCLFVLSAMFARRIWNQRAILRSKRQLQAIFDGITDGLLIIDSDYTIAAINQMEASYLGDSPREIVGTKCHTAYFDRDGVCRNCPCREIFAGSKHVQVTRRRRLINGDIREIDVHTFPVICGPGEKNQVIQHCKDVSEKVKLDERVREIEKLSGMGEMAAHLAHEIKNPLIAIGGFARSLSEELPADHPGADEARVIAEEVKRLERILDDRLSVTKYLRPRFRRVDVNTLVRDVLNLLAYAPLNPGVTVHKKLSEDLPQVAGDQDQLKQAFLNVLLNGIQSIGKSGTLSVSTYRQADNVCARFADSGSGIAEEVMERLFVPFSTTKKNGVGLGLSITRCIIENHGGAIHAANAKSGGAVFTVSLPALAAGSTKRNLESREYAEDTDSR
jgi:PAS domain S-box-containing protein